MCNPSTFLSKKVQDQVQLGKVSESFFPTRNFSFSSQRTKICLNPGTDSQVCLESSVNFCSFNGMYRRGLIIQSFLNFCTLLESIHGIMKLLVLQCDAVFLFTSSEHRVFPGYFCDLKTHSYLSQILLFLTFNFLTL